MIRSQAFAVLIAGCLTTFSANAQTAVSHGGDPTPPPAYDFVQQAGKMTFDGTSMTLSDLGAGTLFFSERPYRLGGQLSNADFAGLWSQGGTDSFSENPPNAAVSILGQTGTAPALVELTSAKVDGSSIVYGVKVLRGDLPQSAENVALFVDHGPRPRRQGAGNHAARHGAGAPPPHHGTGATAPHGNSVGFEPYGPYCYHSPQDPRCRAWHHPYHPYYPPYPPYGPYYHPGAAYAAGVATGAAIANANKPTYYYYPIPTGQLPPNCWINSQHTQMVCTVPIQ